MHISVGLRIMADDLVPDLITTTLSTEPSSCWKKGDCIPTAEGMGGASSGTWCLYSDTVQTSNIADHFNWLTDKLGPISEQLQQLKKDGYWVELFCNLSGQNPVGFTLSSKVLSAIARLGLEVDVMVDSQSDTTETLVYTD